MPKQYTHELGQIRVLKCPEFFQLAWRKLWKLWSYINLDYGLSWISELRVSHRFKAWLHHDVRALRPLHDVLARRDARILNLKRKKHQHLSVSMVKTRELRQTIRDENMTKLSAKRIMKDARFELARTIVQKILSLPP